MQKGEDFPRWHALLREVLGDDQKNQQNKDKKNRKKGGVKREGLYRRN